MFILGNWRRATILEMAVICHVQTPLLTFITTMSAKYERLPTTPNSPPSTSSSRSSSPSPTQTTFSQPLMTKSRAEAIVANQELTRELQRKTDRDPRFNVPKPSTWKRVSLLVFILALVWLAISLRMAAVKREPPVVHANR